MHGTRARYPPTPAWLQMPDRILDRPHCTSLSPCPPQHRECASAPSATKQAAETLWPTSGVPRGQWVKPPRPASPGHHPLQPLPSFRRPTDTPCFPPQASSASPGKKRPPRQPVHSCTGAPAGPGAQGHPPQASWSCCLEPAWPSVPVPTEVPGSGQLALCPRHAHAR